MSSVFARLEDHEIELLHKAPILVCILIAGADGTIDRKEIKEAIRFAEKKNRQASSSLAELFHEIFSDFEDKLKIVMQGYPYESTQRTPMLVEELAQLNAVWPKLAPEFAKEFYNTLKDIASKVAESSGGLLGYKSIGEEEARYVHLPMIQQPA